MFTAKRVQDLTFNKIYLNPQVLPEWLSDSHAFSSLWTFLQEQELQNTKFTANRIYAFTEINMDHVREKEDGR